MSLIIRILLAALLFFFFNSPAAAQEYRTDYKVEYFINQTPTGLGTRVNFSVKTTNLRSDVYVKKFSLSFPKSFQISNLKAKDDIGSLNAKVAQSGQDTIIEAEFTEPKLGKDTTNTLILDFEQTNLFQSNGNVWEVILPTIENRGEGTYQVIVNLPGDKKKISLAKPKPDNIEGTKITWNNPSSKTIYAVFGDNQIFDLNLTYHIKNDQLNSGIIDVAFPPDTVHQKIFMRTITPKPESIFIDDDGNYIGRYKLRSKEQKEIQFSGSAQLFINPRDEVKVSNLTKLKQQEKYLLNETEFWKISQPQRFGELNSAKKIYDFIVQNFKYNYNRVAGSKSFGRLGANIALQKPDQAICVEFTDTFIALAREHGIMTREIQGYAVTQSPDLRPLSLVKDLLHSWPEYYDTKFQNWVQIDPTWQNTSGIDYFSSFDLNHIAFVIHGKSDSRPLPAGMYKISDTQDVTVRASSNLPVIVEKMRIASIEVDTSLNDTTPVKGNLNVKNEGNVFLYNIPIHAVGKNLDITFDNPQINGIAPSEERSIPFRIKAHSKNQYKQASLTIEIGTFDKATKNVKVTPYSYTIGLWIGILSIVFFGLLVLLIRSKRKKKRA